MLNLHIYEVASDYFYNMKRVWKQEHTVMDKNLLEVFH